jgi:hypothetical protein
MFHAWLQNFDAQIQKLDLNSDAQIQKLGLNSDAHACMHMNEDEARQGQGRGGRKKTTSHTHLV